MSERKQTIEDRQNRTGCVETLVTREAEIIMNEMNTEVKYPREREHGCDHCYDVVKILKNFKSTIIKKEKLNQPGKVWVLLK